MKKGYTLHFAAEQIKTQAVTHILLMLTVMAMSSLFIIVSTQINYFRYNYSIFDSFGEHGMLFVAYGERNPEVDEMFDMLTGSNDSLYKELTGTEGINFDFTCTKRLLYNNTDITIVCYQDIMAQNMRLPLSVGKQLSESEIKDGRYPVLLVSGDALSGLYKVGDTFDIPYDDYIITEKIKSASGTKYNERLIKNMSFRQIYNIKSFSEHTGDYTGEDSDYEITKTEGLISVYVCGIIKQPARYFYDGICKTVPGIIEEVIINPPLNSTTVLMKDETLKNGKKLSEIKGGASPNMLHAVIEAAYGSDEYLKRLDELEKKYDVISYNELLERGFLNYTQGAGDYIVILILLIIISVTGIAGVNLFLTEKLRPEYAIYFMSGARWRDCVLIDTARCITVVLLPSLIGAASGIGYIFYVTDMKSFLSMSFITYTVLFMAVVFVLSSLIFLIKLFRTKPIDNIRLMESD